MSDTPRDELLKACKLAVFMLNGNRGTGGEVIAMLSRVIDAAREERKEQITALTAERDALRAHILKIDRAYYDFGALRRTHDLEAAIEQAVEAAREGPE